VSPVLEEWCKRRDSESNNNAIYRNRPEIKKKRTAHTRELVKSYQLAERKATGTGKAYASGMAVNNREEEETSKTKRDTMDLSLAELALCSDVSTASDETRSIANDTEEYADI
jgi:hypothetical protein